MATLITTDGRKVAHKWADLPLGPVTGDDNHQDLGASVRFEIGAAGDPFVATASGPFHLLCGDETVTADTSCPYYDGSVRLVLPDECTHVAMIEAEADVSGCAYRG